MTDSEENNFFAPPIGQEEESFEPSLDGYEGPLHVLLDLARNQKVDLMQISLLELAEQYLAFIRREMPLDIAANYLVMAYWLAYLKSRLLLPSYEEEEEISREEMDARLRFRLQRLEAMRETSQKLMERNLLGRDVFARGMPEGIHINRETKYEASLYDLLISYSNRRLQVETPKWNPKSLPVYSLSQARKRLEKMLGKIQDWDRLDNLFAQELKASKKRRSTLASSFNVALEFARTGRVELRQQKNFAPLYVRRGKLKIASREENSG
ncbi:MAG: segregation and condensation protein A [Parvibaculales bacterium]